MLHGYESAIIFLCWTFKVRVKTWLMNFFRYFFFNKTQAKTAKWEEKWFKLQSFSVAEYHKLYKLHMIMNLCDIKNFIKLNSFSLSLRKKSNQSFLLWIISWDFLMILKSNQLSSTFHQSTVLDAFWWCLKTKKQHKSLWFFRFLFPCYEIYSEWNNHAWIRREKKMK